MPGNATVESSATGAAAPRAARHRGAGETVVVIGNGMAGWKLCERVTALAGRGRLRLVVYDVLDATMQKSAAKS